MARLGSGLFSTRVSFSTVTSRSSNDESAWSERLLGGSLFSRNSGKYVSPGFQNYLLPQQLTSKQQEHGVRSSLLGLFATHARSVALSVGALLVLLMLYAIAVYSGMISVRTLEQQQQLVLAGTNETLLEQLAGKESKASAVASLFSSFLSSATLSILKQDKEEDVTATSRGSVPLVAKSCDPACDGTCNLELGRCDCAYNMSANPACHETTIPECLLPSGHYQPCMFESTCRCQLACYRKGQRQTGFCYPEVDRAGKPKDLSDLDSIFSDLAALPNRSMTDEEIARDGWAKFVNFDLVPEDVRSKWNFQAPTKCNKECSKRGVCLKDGNCLCTRLGFFGASCEMEVPPPFSCFNDCWGKGRCITGQCICEEGFWGVDCSITRGPNGDAIIWTPRDFNLTGRWEDVHPKIYIYDLPPYLGQLIYANAQPGLVRTDEVYFLDRLLTSPYRTLNAEEADYFYIPVYMMLSEDGYNKLRVAVDYIRKTWPYFDRLQGHRHLLYSADDWGLCNTHGFPLGLKDALALNFTALHPWGHVYNLYGGRTRPCYVQGQDIVTPPMEYDNVVLGSPFVRDLEKQPLVERTELVFFAGLLLTNDGRGAPGPEFGTDMAPYYLYSFGYRQRIWHLYVNRTREEGQATDMTGVVITDKGALGLTLEGAQKAKFCLCPVGLGFGQRTTQMIVLGCVPVLIQENVTQAFEYDYINWEELSIRVLYDDLPKLIDILRAVPESEYLRMKEAGAKVWKRMVYTTYETRPKLLQKFPNFHKEDAFATVMEILGDRARGKGKPIILSHELP